MAGKIKGITIELNANATKLDKALKDVNKASKTTQDNLKAVDKALKFDPTNTELLTQKQRLLAEAVDEAGKKVDLLKQKQKEMADAVAAGTASQTEYDTLNRKLQAAEGQLDKAKTAAEKFNVPVEKMKGYLDKASGALDSAAEKTKKYSAAAAGVVAGLAGLAIKAGQTADELNTLSAQTGINTETLQELQYASGLVDVEVSTITGSLKKLTSQMKKAKDGNKGTAEAFEKLGVKVTDANGNLRDNEDVFYDVLEALSKVENETDRDAAAMELFGKSASDLNPIIQDGGKQLKELGKEAKDAGLIMSQDALDGANRFNDALDKLKATAEASFNKVGGELAEALIPVAEELGEWIGKILEWIRGLGADNLLSILKIGVIIAAVSPVLDLLGKISGGMTLILQHPLIAAAAGIAALIGGIAIAASQATYEQNIYMDAAMEFGSKIGETIQKIRDYKQAVDDNAQASKDASGKVNDLYTSYYKLWDRLDKITDAQGNVIKGYEQEAMYIKDTLEDALGIHIQLVKGQITNYDELKKMIDKVIERKRAEAILNANEAAYAQAYEDRKKLTDAVTEAEERHRQAAFELQKQYEWLNQIDHQRKKLMEEEKRVMEDGTLTVGERQAAYDRIDAQLNELDEKEQQIMATNIALTQTEAEMRAALDDAHAAWEKNESILHNYEDLSVAVTTGTGDVNQAIDNLVNGVTNLNGLLDTAQTNFFRSFETMGKQAGKGLEKGIRSSITDAEAAARDLGNRVQRGVEQALLISSPSKVMAKDGRFTVEGFAQGIVKNLNMVDRAAAAMTDSVMGQAGVASTSEGAQVMAAGTGRQPIIVNMTQPIYLGGKTVGNAVTESVIENITAQQGLQAAFVGV